MDDLDETSSALLSMVRGASVVVDNADEVVRANPSAYVLGVVSDDAISDERMLNEIHNVRRRGGYKQFDMVTTSSPQRFIDVNTPQSDPRDSRDIAHEVTLTNWLKVTVGRINARFVVVIIDDVSDIVRFAKVRESFITNVSEQLLKPTQAIEHLADVLERDHVDPAELKHDAQLVRSSSNHLNHMVSDLLLLIKAQEPVTPSAANQLSLMRQLDWAAQNVDGKARKAGVDVNVDGDESLMVNADKDQLRAAIVKLVENAIAYSPRGSSVGVSATRSSDGEHAIVRVIDNGVGIDKSEQTRVFERFYRGKNQNEHTQEGIGLGLAIVKHVAVAHHGSAGVWSAPGQGSTFSLTLPVAH